jgi:hypothetical protein
LVYRYPDRCEALILLGPQADDTLAVTRAIDRLNRTPVDHRELVIRPRLVVRGTTAARATVD